MGLVKIVMQAFKTLGKASIVEIGDQLLKLDGVKSVDIKVNDVDSESISLTISVEGINLDFEKIRNTLENLNVVISSIDEIAMSKDSSLLKEE